jgi:hypothetical protein
LSAEEAAALLREPIAQFVANASAVADARMDWQLRRGHLPDGIVMLELIAEGEQVLVISSVGVGKTEQVLVEIAAYLLERLRRGANHCASAELVVLRRFRQATGAACRDVCRACSTA